MRVNTSNRGAALLAALCFATILAISLGSYMTVCYRELALSTRSTQGSRSVQLAEMGMEDALWALNKNDWSSWTVTGTTATRTISGLAFDGGSIGSIGLKITNYDGTTGTRSVTVTGTMAQVDGTSVSRTLTSTSARAPLFLNAVAATTGTVRFLSAGTVNSYDSSLGSYGSQTPTYSAVVCSGSTGTSSATVQLTNAQISGYVATLSTGPSYSSSAKLIGPTTPITTRIDTTRTSTSPYQPLFDEVIPSGASTLVSNGTSTIGSAGATTPSLYYATDLTLNGGQTLTINGPVIITVTGNLSITQHAQIRVTATGSAQIHVAGSIALDGDGLRNDTLLPKNFLLIGSSTTGTAEMGTTTDFHGVIYTPSIPLTVSNAQTIYGALVGKSVTFNASPVIHYDLDLRRAVFSGFDTPFAVSDWRETNAQ